MEIRCLCRHCDILIIINICKQKHAKFSCHIIALFCLSQALMYVHKFSPCDVFHFLAHILNYIWNLSYTPTPISSLPPGHLPHHGYIHLFIYSDLFIVFNLFIMTGSILSHSTHYDLKDIAPLYSLLLEGCCPALFIMTK